MDAQALYIPMGSGPDSAVALDPNVEARIDSFIGRSMMNEFDFAELDENGRETDSRIINPIRSNAIHTDGAHFDSWLANDGVRADAVEGGGSALARQLDYVYKQVLEEPIPTRNGLKTFRRDTTVPVGAKTHTVRRFLFEGESKIHEGTNDDVPMVGYSQVEEQFPIKYLVTSFRSQIFASQSARFASIPEQRLKMKAARVAIEQLMNRLIYNGNVAHKLWGMTNYPYMGVKTLATTFAASTSPADMLAELNALADFPIENSEQAFEPNHWQMSTFLYNLFSETRLGSVNDTTVMEFFLKSHPNIKTVDKVQELSGAGPGGTDGILFYDDSELGATYVVPQGITPLPLQLSGFEQIRYVYASFGGVVQRNSGSNIIGWATTG